MLISVANLKKKSTINLLIFVDRHPAKSPVRLLILLEMNYVSIYFREHERGVVQIAHFSFLHGGHRRWSTPHDLVAFFLGSGIDDLPTTVAWRKVRSGHPDVVPNVEVPAGVFLAFWTSFDFVAKQIEIPRRRRELRRSKMQISNNYFDQNWSLFFRTYHQKISYYSSYQSQKINVLSKNNIQFC